MIELHEFNVISKRKINRVKHYRSSADTTEYFDLIDIPSFTNHLTLFQNNYDLIIDNTSYQKPSIKQSHFVKLWISKVFDNTDVAGIGFLQKSEHFKKSLAYSS